MLRKALYLSGLAAAGVALATCGPSTAQSTAPQAAATPAPAPVAMTDADPALWVVKDKDTTIYLFGTVHALKPGLSWFDEAVKKAFDSSDTLMLEIVQPDPAKMQSLVMTKAINASGPTLPDRLPEADRPLFAKAVADVGLPEHALDRFQPWFAATTLSVLPIVKLGYTPENGPETVLAKAAADEKKPVAGLETVEEQLGFLADMPEPLQIKFLESTLKDLPKAGTTMGGMVAAWAAGDPDTLASFMNEGMEDSPELAQRLLFDRNARWAQFIKTRLDKPGTVFIAVGAGHLAGAKSVQEQLKALNIKVTRIAY